MYRYDRAAKKRKKSKLTKHFVKNLSTWLVLSTALTLALDRTARSALRWGGSTASWVNPVSWGGPGPGGTFHTDDFVFGASVPISTLADDWLGLNPSTPGQITHDDFTGSGGGVDGSPASNPLALSATSLITHNGADGSASGNALMPGTVKLNRALIFNGVGAGPVTLSRQVTGGQGGGSAALVSARINTTVQGASLGTTLVRSILVNTGILSADSVRPMGTTGFQSVRKATFRGNGTTDISSSQMRTLTGQWNGNGSLFATGSIALKLPVLDRGTNVNFADGTLATTTGPSTADDIDLSQEAGSFAVSGFQTTTLAGVISGDGSLTASGAGTLVISGAGANTFTGLTTVASGTLVLDKATGTAIPGNGVSSDVEFNILVNGGTLLWRAGHQLKSTVSIGITAGTVNLNGFDETFYELNNYSGTFVTGNGGTVVIADPVWGNGSTNTVSPGSTLTVGNLDVQGGTNTVDGLQSTAGQNKGGTLKLQPSGPNASPSVTFDRGGTPTITVNSDPSSAGLIQLTGSQNTVFADVVVSGNTTAKITNGGSAALPGQLDLDGATRTFNVGTGSTLTISAQIIDSTNGSTHNLDLTGGGTVTLSGTNTFPGPTNVGLNGAAASPTQTTGSKLVVSGSLAGSVAVNAGNTLASGNNVNSQIAALTANSSSTTTGAVVAPGDTAGSGLTSIGQLNVTGDVTLGSSSSDSNSAHLSMEIGGIQDGSGVGNAQNNGGLNTTNAGTLQYDRIAMGGTLNLTGISLDITTVSGYSFTNPSFNNSTQQLNLDGHVFFLITGATSSVAGTFSNQGAADSSLLAFNTILSNGQLFAISYTANFSNGTFTGGNDVAVMAIPEPNAMSMLAGSVGLALGLQRLRRRNSSAHA